MEQQAQAKLRRAYGEAWSALRAGRAATAERQLRAIQADAPGDINSLRLLGVALLDQEKVSAAVDTEGWGYVNGYFQMSPHRL
jgi:predicted Zn-dependent protease